MKKGEAFVLIYRRFRHISHGRDPNLPKKSKKEYPSEELPVPSHPSPAMYKFNLPIAVYIVYKLEATCIDYKVTGLRYLIQFNEKLSPN